MSARRTEPLVKAGWHALLVVAAVIEYRMSETQFRKNLCLATAGWHTAAMLDDLGDLKKARQYEGNT